MKRSLCLAVVAICFGSCGAPHDRAAPLTADGHYLRLTPQSLGTGPANPEDVQGLSQIHVSPDETLIYLDQETSNGGMADSGRGILMTSDCLRSSASPCRMNKVESLQQLKFAGWSTDSRRLYLIEGSDLTELSTSVSAAPSLVNSIDKERLDRELAFTFHGGAPVAGSGGDEVAGNLRRRWSQLKQSQPRGLTLWETALAPSGDLVSVYEDDNDLSLTFIPTVRANITTRWLRYGHIGFIGPNFVFHADGVTLTPNVNGVRQTELPWAGRLVSEPSTGRAVAVQTPHSIHPLIDERPTAESLYTPAGTTLILDAQAFGDGYLTLEKTADGDVRLCMTASVPATCFGQTPPSTAPRLRQVAVVRSAGLGDLNLTMVEESSVPNRRAVVFFHGGPAGTASRLPAIQLLTLARQPGWDVILVEYSGSVSYGPDRTKRFLQAPFQTLAEDAEALEEYLENSGYGTVAIVGHSFGALPAIQLDRALSEPHCTVLLVPLLQYRDPQIWTPRHADYQRRVDVATLGQGPNGLRGFAARLQTFSQDWRPRYPVLAVFGDADGVSKASDLGAEVGAQTLVVRGDHNFSITDPRVESTFGAFLNQCPSET